MPYRKTKPTPRALSKGFTLVEVLTAALLGTMLLSIFLVFAFRFTKVFEELGGSEIKLSTEANRVLDVIEGDLSSVIMRKDSFEWLAYWNDITQSGPLGAVKKALPGTGKNLGKFPIENSGVLLCLSRSPSLSEDEKEDGDVAAVAWRVAYLDPAIPELDRDPDDANKPPPGATFCLYRILNPPGTTFDEFLAKEDFVSEWQGDTSNGGASAAAPPYDANCLRPDFLQLRNVVDFSIRFFVSYLPKRDPTAGPSANKPRDTLYHELSSPIRIGGKEATNIKSSTNKGLPNEVPDFAHLFPVTAVVRIKVISDEGIKVMRAALEGKHPAMKDMEQLVEQYGYTFQRTVMMPTPI